MNTAEDLSTKAKSLYWQAFSITQISKEIGVSINTIYSWRRRYEWDKATPMQRVQDRTHVRYLRLVEKDDKTPKDFKEIDLLARQLDRFERHERRDQEKEKKAKTPKNHFTEEQITQLRALVFDSLGVMENAYAGGSIRNKKLYFLSVMYWSTPTKKNGLARV